MIFVGYDIMFIDTDHLGSSLIGMSTVAGALYGAYTGATGLYGATDSFILGFAGANISAPVGAIGGAVLSLTAVEYGPELVRKTKEMVDLMTSIGEVNSVYSVSSISKLDSLKTPKLAFDNSLLLDETVRSNIVKEKRRENAELANQLLSNCEEYQQNLVRPVTNEKIAKRKQIELVAVQSIPKDFVTNLQDGTIGVLLPTQGMNGKMTFEPHCFSKAHISVMEHKEGKVSLIVPKDCDWKISHKTKNNFYRTMQVVNTQTLAMRLDKLNTQEAMIALENYQGEKKYKKELTTGKIKESFEKNANDLLNGLTAELDKYGNIEFLSRVQVKKNEWHTYRLGSTNQLYGKLMDTALELAKNPSKVKCDVHIFGRDGVKDYAIERKAKQASRVLQDIFEKDSKLFMNINKHNLEAIGKECVAVAKKENSHLFDKFKEIDKRYFEGLSAEQNKVVNTIDKWCLKNNLINPNYGFDTFIESSFRANIPTEKLYKMYVSEALQHGFVMPKEKNEQRKITGNHKALGLGME